MPDSRSLAFLATPEAASRVPEDVVVVPLHPNVVLPDAQRLVPRPEALLGTEDFTAIDRTTGGILEGLRDRLQTDALRWHGVDLFGCFVGEAELGLRDALKTARVIDRALEQTAPSSLLTDVPASADRFPAYPYMSAMGTLLAARATEDGTPFQSLAAPSAPSPTPSPSWLAKAYLTVTARRGLRTLQGSRPITALGPYPEFYIPVAKAAFAASGSSFLVITRQSHPMRADARSGLAVLSLEAFVEGTDRERIEAFTARAAPVVREAAQAEADRAGAGAVGAVLRAHLGDRFSEEGPALALLGLAFERGLARARAAIAVETESPLARAFVQYARAHGVPVTVLQHGVLAGAFSYARTDADRLAAWGPADEKWFQSHAARTLRAEGTGCPRYDGVRLELGAPNRRSVDDRLPGRPMVLFASQPFVQDRSTRSVWARAEALQMAIAAAAEIRELFLAVKWHPAETPEPLPREAASYARVVRGNAMELARASRVVLAMSSTVAFEAMLLDRPVVFLGPADPESPFHPPEDGAGRRARDRAELVGHLRELIPDGSQRQRVLEGQRRFLSERYAPLDGAAARRVAMLVMEG